MLNHIVIMGRLTKDPEIRYTQSQIPVTSFSLAVDRDFGKDENGQKQTDFIDCVAWRNTAEFVSKYFTKGTMAAVSGRLQLRDWTAQDGSKRRNAEVVVDNIYFGESKNSRSNNSEYGNPYGAAPAAPAYGYSAAPTAYSQPYGAAPAYAPAAGQPTPASQYSDPFAQEAQQVEEGDLPF